MSNSLMNTVDYLTNSDVFNRMTQFSEMMASGRSTIPQHLQGNAADCMAVVMQATAWGMSPFAVAQKTFLVSGTLGYEAQLVNAVINSLAPTKDRLHFDYYGPWEKVIGKFKQHKNSQGKYYLKPDWSFDDEQGCGIKVYATLKGEDEPRVLDLLLTQAQVRNSTLWASDPKQQLAYLGIKRWSRLYCPDVIMGVYTPDELEERTPERDITPDRKPAKTSAALGAINKGKKRKPKIVEPEIIEHEEIENVAPVEVSEIFKQFRANIQGCCDMNELNEVSGALSINEELTTDEMNMLRQIYSVHKKDITV